MKRVLFTCLTLISARDLWADSNQLYSSDADFDFGTFVGVNHDAPNNNQLQLNVSGSSFPVLWIANAGENTLSKVDSTQKGNSPGREIARYRTWFNNSNAGSPSRTAVDKFGNAYVLNRAFGGYPTVFKILNNTYIDRNKNGVLDTSSDLNNNGTIQSNEIISLVDKNNNGMIDPDEIQDERIDWVKRVPDGMYQNGLKRYDGVARALCIGTDGNLWIGMYNYYEYYKISAETGTTIAGPVVTNYPNYGCLIDQNGTLWGANWSHSKLTRISNTTSNSGPYSVSSISVPSPVYGIALRRDENNAIHVIMGGSCNSYVDYNDSTKSWARPAAVNYCTYAVGTDNNGNILVSKSSGGVAKFDPFGRVLWDKGSQVGNSDSRGVIADSNNDIWQVHLGTNNMAKYKGTDGGFLGVVPVGVSPYTYSDASGTAALSITTKTGSWSTIQDTGSIGKKRVLISWNANIPANTSIVVEGRASNNKGSFTQVFQPVTNNTPLLLNGRYLEVKATLNANPQNQSPTLYDISVSASILEQTINTPLAFDPPTLKVGGTTTVSATATSGLPVEFSANTPATCTVNGSQVNGIKAGICTIAADQSGNEDYLPAPQVTDSITVAKGEQTLTRPEFTTPELSACGTTNVSVSGSSHLQIALTTNTPDTCTIKSSAQTICAISAGCTTTAILQGVATGICSISANQAGDNDYNPALQTQSNIQVVDKDCGPSSQTINNMEFNPPILTYLGTTTVNATATSGLAVTFQTLTPKVCVLGSDNVLSALKLGTCTIAADQAGDAKYQPAPQVIKSIQIEKALQTILFDALPNKTYGDPPFTVKAKTSAGLKASFVGTTPDVCSVVPVAETGMTGVTLLNTGTCTIQANHPGNGSYQAAPTVTQSFQVIPRTAVVTLNNLTQIYDGKKKNASCSARPYSAQQAMISTKITYSDIGSGIGRIQVGNYGVQCEVTQVGYVGSTSGTMVISNPADKIFQSITIGTLPDKHLGDPPFSIPATASSKLPVTFVTVPANSSICTVSGDTVTLSGTGICVIKISQPGDATYQAAVDQYLIVTVLP